MLYLVFKLHPFHISVFFLVIPHTRKHWLAHQQWYAYDSLINPVKKQIQNVAKNLLI
jgi:hypothetical protein